MGLALSFKSCCSFCRHLSYHFTTIFSKMPSQKQFAHNLPAGA